MKYDCPIDLKKKDENSHSTVTKTKVIASEELFQCESVYLNHAPLDSYDALES